MRPRWCSQFARPGPPHPGRASVAHCLSDIGHPARSPWKPSSPCPLGVTRPGTDENLQSRSQLFCPSPGYEHAASSILRTVETEMLRTTATALVSMAPAGLFRLIAGGLMPRGSNPVNGQGSIAPQGRCAEPGSTVALSRRCAPPGPSPTASRIPGRRAGPARVNPLAITGAILAQVTNSLTAPCRAQPNPLAWERRRMPADAVPRHPGPGKQLGDQILGQRPIAHTGEDRLQAYVPASLVELLEFQLLHAPYTPGAAIHLPRRPGISCHSGGRAEGDGPCSRSDHPEAGRAQPKIPGEDRRRGLHPASQGWYGYHPTRTSASRHYVGDLRSPAPFGPHNA